MPSKRRRLKGRKGEYLVLAELTRGGMSAVHLARVKDDEGQERFVIFRELLPHLSQEKESVERFLKEAKITYQFDHPNLVPTQEVVKMQAGYFSIAEFLVGDGLGYVLARALETGNDLPVHLAVELVAQACAGVGFVHRLADKSGRPLGLVHKNVNLRNLIVLPSGRVKVVNFDIARPENRPHPSRVTAYLSPEQCVGKPLGARSDVFSLGVVLWELLARRHLFMREDDMETRRAVMACKVPPVGEFRTEVPEEIAGVAMRVLSKDPSGRFADAGEMGDALREAQGQPPDAAEVQEYLDALMSARFEAKQSMLEQIRASEDAPVDPDVLLPGTSVDLPLVPAEDPHGFDREPVTQRDRDKQEGKPKKAPPNLPPRPRPAVSEREEPEEEPGGRPARESTPPPFRPARRVRSSPRSYLLPGAIAGAVLVVLLIVIIAWPSGDAEDSAEEPGPQASAGEAAEVVPGATAAEGAGEDASAKTGLAVLEIVTDPGGCRVYLDGMRLQGRTPLSNVFIPANTEYRVTVRCKGYRKESREVMARPGERLNVEFVPPPKGH